MDKILDMNRVQLKRLLDFSKTSNSDFKSRFLNQWLYIMKLFMFFPNIFSLIFTTLELGLINPAASPNK
ncbi:MAG: hypothetical protein A3J97_16405 [Spirochaetes bacterium RIFOXYC1_FULL_54_7]|nr:MAG: hypothetical protein A3J97_16405 [Spirochaetes bacterium RIFOXYC1_FULL_54_7]